MNFKLAAPKTWNDFLSLLLIVGIPGLWMVQKWLPMPSEVVGATIVAWTLVVQYYFRQRPPDVPPAP